MAVKEAGTEAQGCNDAALVLLNLTDYASDIDDALARAISALGEGDVPSDDIEIIETHCMHILYCIQEIQNYIEL